MEKQIAEAVNKYARLIENLNSLKLDRSVREGVPEDVQAALARLYYSKVYEEELEKCAALLDENSDAETAEAAEAAQNAVDDASEAAFSAVESYEKDNKEFSGMLEELTVSSDERGGFSLMCRLYKCEGIIRSAYRCASQYPLYGLYASSLRPRSDFDVVMNEEENIKQKLGLDIYELLDVRSRIIAETGRALQDANIGVVYEAGDI